MQAAVVGLFGLVGVVADDRARHAVRLRRSSALPQVACLLAVLSYGFSGVFGRRFRGRPPLLVAAGRLTLLDRAAAAGGAAGRSAVATRSPQPSSVYGFARRPRLARTALAYVIFFRILAVPAPPRPLLVTFLVQVSAVLLGLAFLEEAVTLRAGTGMLLIGLGLAVIDGRLLRAFR